MSGIKSLSVAHTRNMDRMSSRSLKIVQLNINLVTENACCHAITHYTCQVCEIYQDKSSYTNLEWQSSEQSLMYSLLQKNTLAKNLICIWKQKVKYCTKKFAASE